MAATCSNVRIFGPTMGFTEADTSALFLQAGGTMKLLLVQVDKRKTCLMVWWYRDNILRYLQTTTMSFTQILAARMVQHGYYALIPPAHSEY